MIAGNKESNTNSTPAYAHIKSEHGDLKDFLPVTSGVQVTEEIVDSGNDLVTMSVTTFFSPLIEVEDHTVVDPVIEGSDSMITATSVSFDPSDGLLHLVTDFPAPVVTHEKCRSCRMQVRNMMVHMKLNHKKIKGFTGSDPPQQQTKGRKMTSQKLSKEGSKVPRLESTQN